MAFGFVKGVVAGGLVCAAGFVALSALGPVRHLSAPPEPPAPPPPTAAAMPEPAPALTAAAAPVRVSGAGSDAPAEPRPAASQAAPLAPAGAQTAVAGASVGAAPGAGQVPLYGASGAGQGAPTEALPPPATATTELPPTTELPDAIMPDGPAAQPAPPPQPAPTARPTILRLGQDSAASALPQIRPAEPAPTTAPAKAAPADPNAAIVTYAAPFANPQGKPLLSVILVDVGADAGGIAPATVRGLPFPVTIAIDPARPGAAEAARDWRAAGYEVAMLASALPAGAAPPDVETAFAAMLQAMPEAVALVDTPQARFQNDRLRAQHVLALAQAAGLGIATHDRGLDAAGRIAAAAGQPHATIARVLDAQGEDAAAMGRMLDRAAFEAQKTGATVVYGEARAETLTALFEWAARAETVAVAPLSAVALAAVAPATP